MAGLGGTVHEPHGILACGVISPEDIGLAMTVKVADADDLPGPLYLWH